MDLPSNIPPPIICGNDRLLLQYAVLDESVGYTAGHGLFFVDGKQIGRVPCMAICQEKESSLFTLYYCDRDWSLLGVAANYESVDAAKRQAERIFPGLSARWMDSHFTEADLERYRAATASLLSAAERGDVLALKTAIASGANLDGRDEQGWTALFHAANRGKTETLKVLIEEGALNEESFYALFLAVSGGYIEAVRVLLEAGTKLTPDQKVELLDYCVSGVSKHHETILRMLDDNNPEQT
jgi:hypothetical protein